MREYGQIQLNFWSDFKIQKLGDQAKLLALYLLTGPHSNSLGSYRCPDGYVSADLGWDLEVVLKSFAELSEIEFIKRDKVTGWVLIPKYLKWNPIQNPKVGIGVGKLAKLVPPDISIYLDLINSLKRYGERLPDGIIDHINTVFKAYGNKEPDKEPSLPKGKEAENPASSLFDKVLEVCRGENGTRAVFNPYPFVNKMRKEEKAHPQALIRAVSKTIAKIKSETLKGDPWAYATKIFQRENSKFHAQDHEEECIQFNQEFDSFLMSEQGKQIFKHVQLARAP